MDLGSVASFGSSLLSDAFSSGLNFLGTRYFQRDAQHNQASILQNQKQWQVQDLIKAGLNPVLATGLNVSMPSSPVANWTGADSSAMQAALSSERRAERQIASEQLRAATASADSASAKALSDRIEADLKKDFWTNMTPGTRRIMYGQSIMPGSSAGQIAGLLAQLQSGIQTEIDNLYGDMSPLARKYASGEKMTDEEMKRFNEEQKHDMRQRQALEALRNFRIAW